MTNPGPVGPTHPPLDAASPADTATANKARVADVRLDAALLVICKTPAPGRTKTRLCPPLSAEQASAVAWACVLDTLDLAVAVPARRHVLVLDGEPGPWIPDQFEVIAQRGVGLAERLANAFAEVADDAVVIAMDTPQVRVDELSQALAAVTATPPKAVLGPASDGGYWAIGLPRTINPGPVFEAIPMSTAETGAAQHERLVALGCEVELLEQRRDIDDYDDLIAVASLIPGSRVARCVEAVRPRS